MNKCKIVLLFILIPIFQLSSQVLPGELIVNSIPDIVESFNDLVAEAGMNVDPNGFESPYDAGLISFILEAGDLTEAEQLCQNNVYKYAVYIHMDKIIPGLILEAKTSYNSGYRFPASSPYDDMDPQPMGPRDLNPAMGGSYIRVPSDKTQAIKIFEFVGCRTDIPIQFRIKPAIEMESDESDFKICFTVVNIQS